MYMALSLKKLYSDQLLVADENKEIELACLKNLEEEVLLSIWYQGVFSYIKLFTKEDTLVFSLIPKERARHELRESAFSFEQFCKYIHKLAI